MGATPTARYAQTRPTIRTASKVGVMYNSPELMEPEDIGGWASRWCVRG